MEEFAEWKFLVNWFFPDEAGFYRSAIKNSTEYFHVEKTLPLMLNSVKLWHLRSDDDRFNEFGTEIWIKGEKRMIRLANVFQSGMVLQRDKRLPIWGKTQANQTVRIRIQGREASAQSDENGVWELELEPLHTSVKETLIVECIGERLTLEDVAVGEVWIAGGQSNMKFWMRYERSGREEKNVCANTKVRFYDVPEVIYEGQTQDFDFSEMGVWRKATREDLEYFSAVGYYFAKEIEDTLHTPVGIVGCNCGGTNSSVWMREESVQIYGKVWVEAFEETIRSRDMDILWKKQCTNPMCDRGRPFADALTEFAFPITRTKEELDRFYMEHESVFDPENMILFNKPGILFEMMVKKIAPYAARGVLWYQGESDDGEGKAEIHDKMLTALIHDWRNLWGQELPFLIVQLPGFEGWEENSNMYYSVIRSCQERVASTVPQTFLASISDAGEQYDIHPKNKKIVGHRLALLARGHVYGENLLCDAPVPDDYGVGAKEIRIHFANAKGGLECGNMEQLPLELNRDGNRIPSIAEIQGETLFLRTEAPLAGEIEITFAQGKYFHVDLKNQNGIPAIPFLKKVSFEK